jgi:hypothetical protein
MSHHLCNKLLLHLVLLQVFSHHLLLHQQCHSSTLTWLYISPRPHWLYLLTQPSSRSTSFAKHKQSPFARCQLRHLVHLSLYLISPLPACLLQLKSTPSSTRCRHLTAVKYPAATMSPLCEHHHTLLLLGATWRLPTVAAALSGLMDQDWRGILPDQIHRARSERVIALDQS